jgi:tRNA-splicing ligase RtcB
VNDNLKELLFEELHKYTDHGSSGGGFIPAVKQLANVASLPGVVDVRFKIHLFNR